MTALWSLLGLVAELALVGVAAAGPSATTAADRDCSDFDNQAQAQRYFIERGGPRRDPDRLDADGDGVACASLPCPCSRRGAPRPAPRPRRRAQTIGVRVTRVVDGDTIDVRSLERTRRRRYRVRVLGIDSPEVFGRSSAAGAGHRPPPAATAGTSPSSGRDTPAPWPAASSLERSGPDALPERDYDPAC